MIQPEDALPGDLILCLMPKTDTNLVDRAIARLTGGTCIHVAMVHDRFWAMEAYYPRLRAWPRSNYPGSVIVRVSEVEAERAAAVGWFIAHLNKRYSLGLLLIEAFRLLAHATIPDRWLKTLYVCSTSAARAYFETSGRVIVPGISPYLVDPQEIARHYL